MNKEKIYDQQIAPLMAQVIQICKREGITVFAEFQYSEDGFCTTLIPGSEKHLQFTLFDALRQCKEDTGVNLDKFYIWCAKNIPNKSSIVMNLLGKEPAP